MKNEVATRAVAIAELARSSFRGRGDVLFVAVADEEDGSEGVGMRWLVQERPDLAADYLVNEGAAERLELADGRTVVTIDVGEKGAQGVRVTALGEPGHTSLPRAEVGAVARLARLIGRLDSYRPARRIVPQTNALLETLVGLGDGDHLDDSIARAVELHPALAELVEPLFSMSIAPTRLRGSDALNVLPMRASADVDCRPVPGMTEDELRAELRHALGDDIPYELDAIDPLTGGSASPVDTPLFEACRQALAEHDPDAILLPSLCVGFTDSHYARESWGSVAYGIWPVRATPYEVLTEGVHAPNERIHVDDLGLAVRFHVRLTELLLG
jgi:acetylornithine deacetylase/succinyl-diaminopimelate desuccinylase-like protein